MKIILIISWLLLPLAFAAWHYGPGQEQLELDDAQNLIARAEKALSEKEYSAAIQNWEEALGKLPQEEINLGRRLELEIAKAKMQNSQLPEAREELEELILILDQDENCEPALRDETRSALANSRYYVTYLMKLEGLPDAMWEPEIEAARQDYKLLAESAGDSTLAKTSADDLEAAIRLARMEPSELYGQPLPTPCKGCSSGDCPKPGKKPGGKKPQDARGAGSGPPPDGAGS